MGWFASILAVTETLVAILLIPAGLVAVCALALRMVDDRGLYSIPPFLGLAIAGGGLIEAFLLRTTGLASQMTLSAIWAPQAAWDVNLRGLHETYLAPQVLTAQARDALHILLESWPAAWFWVTAYGLALLPVAVVAAFAWRSWRAILAATLFFPVSLTSAVVIHFLIIVTYWVIHWLNFWSLFILVLLFQMRRHEGNDRNLLSP